MYDELVKRLRSKAVYLPEKFSKNAELLDLLMKATDAIEGLSRENESLAKSVNEASEILRKRWIPVTERLPKDMETVIVTDGKNVGFSFCVNDYGTMEFYSPWKITSWMPLPQPPKAEEGET